MCYYVRYIELFEIIHDAHIATGHGGKNRIMYEVNSEWKNVSIITELEKKI
jgi:predicted transcriptional regulator